MSRLGRRCRWSATLFSASLFLVAGLPAFANTCPSSPTRYAVSIPNPNPAAKPGELPLDIDRVLPFVIQNNIRSVKELLDRVPMHLNKHYSFVERTRALGRTDVNNPGLVLFGADARFMMNMSSHTGDPRYEVVDIAYLDETGDWIFRELDFRTNPPRMSADDRQCRSCHGTPARPFWGTYLDWPGIFSDNGFGQELVTSAQARTLTRIKNHQQNEARFHKLRFSYYFDQAGTTLHLPDHAYGPSLTISNNEIASSVAESIHKRAKRSTRYAGLREEYLALSYCDTFAGVLGTAAKNQIKNLILSLGGRTTGYLGAPHWSDIYRLWGLDPEHELAIHKLASERSSVRQEDMNWNTGVSRLREVVDMLILLELAGQSSRVNSVLTSYPASYSMTSCGYLFPTLRQHLDHKHYANFVLKGDARQTARESYYDIDYMRIHQSFDYVRNSLCSALTSSIGTNTLGTLSANVSASANDVIVEPSSAAEAGEAAKEEEEEASYPGVIEAGSVDAAAYGPMPQAAAATELLNGVPVASLSGARGSQRFFSLHVHGQPKDLVVKITGGTGDADMYVRQGSPPTKTSYQCRPFRTGNEETCTFANPALGMWYVMLDGYSRYSRVTLVGSFDEGGGGGGTDACETQAPVYDVEIFKDRPVCVTAAPAPGYYRHYYIRLPSTDAGKTLTIKMSGGTGNADLLVSAELGMFPHEEHYAARPDIVFGSTNPDNNEQVVIHRPITGRDYLITLPAVTAHSGITIVATVQ